MNKWQKRKRRVQYKTHNSQIFGRRYEMFYTFVKKKITIPFRFIKLC